jgi:RNA polymerase sigma-70 factor (ECF subfamily)
MEKRAQVESPSRSSAPNRPYPVPPADAYPDEGAQQLDSLVRGARGGDADAFAGLFEYFHGPVYRYLLARLGNRSEAEDMASEVFVEAARRVRDFDGGGAAFAGWLFTIARNDLFDRGRALSRRVVEPVSNPPDFETEPDPADSVLDRLDADRVRKAMDQLTEEQREVVLLKFASGLSNEETAAAIGKPIGAVKSLQHRGLAALRRVLEEES